jgi:hypothetical protein
MKTNLTSGRLSTHLRNSGEAKYANECSVKPSKFSSLPFIKSAEEGKNGDDDDDWTGFDEEKGNDEKESKRESADDDFETEEVDDDCCCC